MYQVPPTTSHHQVPAMSDGESSSTSDTVRPNQVENAVNFFKNPKVSHFSYREKEDFLKKKGLTDAEIDQAAKEAGVDQTATASPTAPTTVATTAPAAPVVASSAPATIQSYPPAQAVAPPPYQSQHYPPLPVQSHMHAPASPMARIAFGIAIVAGLAGLGAAVKRYVVPALKKRLTDSDDEKCDTALVPAPTRAQSLSDIEFDAKIASLTDAIERSSRQINLRLDSLEATQSQSLSLNSSRYADVSNPASAISSALQSQNMSDIKAEITSIKALLAAGKAAAESSVMSLSDSTIVSGTPSSASPWPSGSVGGVAGGAGSGAVSGSNDNVEVAKGLPTTRLFKRLAQQSEQGVGQVTTGTGQLTASNSTGLSRTHSAPVGQSTPLQSLPEGTTTANCSRPASTSDTPPYSMDFQQVARLVSEGKTPDDVRIIDDRPRDPNAKPSDSTLQPKAKPWEREARGAAAIARIQSAPAQTSSIGNDTSGHNGWAGLNHGGGQVNKGDAVTISNGQSVGAGAVVTDGSDASATAAGGNGQTDLQSQFEAFMRMQQQRNSPPRQTTNAQATQQQQQQQNDQSQPVVAEDGSDANENEGSGSPWAHHHAPSNPSNPTNEPEYYGANTVGN